MNRVRFSFFVPGKPEPGGSKKGYARGKHVSIVDANPKAAPWKARVALAASQAYEGEPLTGALHVVFEFVVTRPRGHFGSGKNADKIKESAPAFPASKPDTLKLTRSTEDACTGILWKDDALIVTQLATKRYGPCPGVKITVQEAQPMDKIDYGIY